MERWDVVVVGAGASGLMAAQAAARTLKAQGQPGAVLLVEGNPKPGKKLLATGNGRCNLTNLHVSPASYHGDVRLADPLLHPADERILVILFVIRFIFLYKFQKFHQRFRHFLSVFPFCAEKNRIASVVRCLPVSRHRAVNR